MRICVVIFLSAISITSFAQISEVDISPDEQPMVKKMEDDIRLRRPSMQDREIEWNRNEQGYSANYNIEKNVYLNRYSAEGELQQILKKDDYINAPALLRERIDNHPDFTGYEVADYWIIENEDYTPTGNYILNMRNSQGEIRRVTISEDGNIMDDELQNRTINNDEKNPARDLVEPKPQSE